jgi:hypothetical protein
MSVSFDSKLFYGVILTVEEAKQWEGRYDELQAAIGRRDLFSFSPPERFAAGAYLGSFDSCDDEEYGTPIQIYLYAVSYTVEYGDHLAVDLTLPADAEAKIARTLEALKLPLRKAQWYLAGLHG